MNKNKKCLNIQSPEFVPDTSLSSSNGDNTLNNTFSSEVNWPGLNYINNSPDLDNNSFSGV